MAGPARPWSKAYDAALRMPREIAAPYILLLRGRRDIDEAGQRAIDADFTAMFNGGLAVQRLLAGPCPPNSCRADTPGYCTIGGRVCRRARVIGVVIQPDGDVVLSLPADFADHPEVAAMAHAVLDDARARLTRLPDARPAVLVASGLAIASDATVLTAAALPFAEMLLAPESLGLVPVALIASRYLARPALGAAIRWSGPRLAGRLWKRARDFLAR